MFVYKYIHTYRFLGILEEHIHIKVTTILSENFYTNVRQKIKKIKDAESLHREVCIHFLLLIKDILVYFVVVYDYLIHMLFMERF
jgi:hypothetical protein